MPNPNPPLENLKSFEPIGDEPLSRQQLQVRVAQDVHDAIARLGKGKAEWLRRVITDAARAELMGDATAPAPALELEPEPEQQPKRRRGPRTAGKAIAMPRHTKTERPKFAPGDCCRMPSGARVFVDKYLGDGRYQVTWEVGGAADEVQGRSLTLVAKGK